MSVVDSTTSVEYREIPGMIGFRFGSDGTPWSRWIRGHAKLGKTWKLKAVHVSRRHGYLQVNIKADRSYGARPLHLLIATAFHGPCPPGMQCRHMDGNKLNSRADNLAWGTPSENNRDKIAHGTDPVGERHGCAKMTDEKVREIRKLRSQGLRLKQIGEMFGVRESTISLIVNRRTWPHVD
jgi:hypothetical protein